MITKPFHYNNIHSLVLISTLLFLIIICAYSCVSDAKTEQDTTTSEDTSYGSDSNTDKQARDKAMKMLGAIGGKEKWANLKAIYYREKVDQNGIDSTFYEEKWIDLTAFKMRTEQKIEKFHRAGLFSDKGGWIINPETGKSRALSKKELQKAKYEYKRNMYVLIYQLATRNDLTLKMRNKDRFDIYERDTLLGGFNINAQNQPEFYGFQRFLQGNRQTNIQITGWLEADGLTYAQDGHTLNKKRYFVTDKWKAFTLPFEEAFDVKYYLEEELQ